MLVDLQAPTSAHSPQHLQRNRVARLCRPSSHSCSRHHHSGELLLAAAVGWRSRSLAFWQAAWHHALLPLREVCGGTRMHLLTSHGVACSSSCGSTLQLCHITWVSLVSWVLQVPAAAAPGAFGSRRVHRRRRSPARLSTQAAGQAEGQAAGSRQQQGCGGCGARAGQHRCGAVVGAHATQPRPGGGGAGQLLPAAWRGQGEHSAAGSQAKE